MRKKFAEFWSEIMRTERNTPIRIEGEGVVLGYDHIALEMNPNQK